MIPSTGRNQLKWAQETGQSPSISIIFPFEPKMRERKDLENQLNETVNTAEKRLLALHSPGETQLVTDRLKQLIQRLDYNTYKQAIAIFVSPWESRVFYLDIPVVEKLIIDKPFETRDFVYSKNEIQKYLVLILSSEHTRIFLSDETQFIRVAFRTPPHISSLKKNLSGRAFHFPEQSDRKRIVWEKLLHYIDDMLGPILKSYPLPLFVLGTDKATGHFKKITHHSARIKGYIHGNFEWAPEARIHAAIAPYAACLKKEKQQDLLSKLHAAMSAKKLVVGIQNAWEEANQKKGRLLVIERNYSHISLQPDPGEGIGPLCGMPDTALCIRNMVDDTIDKVLKNGGEVKFIDEELLSEYGHIALVLF